LAAKSVSRPAKAAARTPVKRSAGAFLSADDFERHQRLPGWVLGYHGCDIKTAHAALTDAKTHLEPSRNSWDWLGDGVYFWENDPVRALQFAEDGKANGGRVTKGKIEIPYVIGAIIDLGICCNLYDQAGLSEFKAAYEDFRKPFDTYGAPIPQNKDNGRFLDRAVIQHMHETRSKVLGLLPYQTVRAAFPEGKPVYAGCGLTEQNHIQIAVLDKSCIRGYFLPRKSKR
jgi:hypothetical protein